ncbi:unnamed protein product [Rotaria sp. Silwood2]|nr:unnamed protein product [Rotaria sp. Silwood2]
MWSHSTSTIIRQSFEHENLIHSSSITNTTTTSISSTTSIIQTLATPNDIYDSRITKPFALICLFVGSIGNSLSFIVFKQKQLRKHSTFRYLAYLSIVDLIVLYLGLGYIILRDYFSFDIRVQNLFLCKFHTFLTYVTTQLSSWILTIVSIDRAIACTVMQLNKRLSRPKSADRIFFIMCIVISLINSHILLFMGSKRTIVESFIHNTSLSKDIIISVKGKTRKGTRRAKQVSYMLLTLNLVFVILLTPIVIGQIFQELNQEHRYRLYNSITLLMSYSNHALNFVLYGIASPQFRITLKQLLGFENHYLAHRRFHTFGYCTTTAF